MQFSPSQSGQYTGISVQIPVIRKEITFLYRRLMISAEFCCVFYIHHQEDKYALYYLTYFYYL